VPDRLDSYRRKRDLAVSPEPDDEPRADGDAPRFVIHEHHARNLHWDLRLERDGVLVSFALPRGLPLDATRNRLALHTEDHPLAYLDFAGEIPAGQYGAGTMTVFDAGTYVAEKFRDDEVIVRLRGARVEGRYVLFRTGGRNWLIHLMAAAEGSTRDPFPEGIEPMLAKPSSLPSDDDAWAFEIKWDGVRTLAYVSGGHVQLRSRGGLDVTATYPELQEIGRALGMTEALLDGEIVALDDAGQPSFGTLQRRLNVASEAALRRLQRDVPVIYEAFDLLYLDGHATTALAYRDRRALLEGLDLAGKHVATPAAHVGDGQAMLDASRAQGLEGIVGKRLAAPYEPGRRSGAWIKLRNPQRVECVIGGYTRGESGRSGRLGALVVGVREPDGGLRCAGKVGSGIAGAALDEIEAALEPLRTSQSPFTAGSVPRGAILVEPRLACIVEYTEWTSSRTLRHPVFKGLVAPSRR